MKVTQWGYTFTLAKLIGYDIHIKIPGGGARILQGVSRKHKNRFIKRFNPNQYSVKTVDMTKQRATKMHSRYKKFSQLQRIYVEQYGIWWSFNRGQWKEFIEKNLDGMINGDGFELPNERRIKNKPRCAMHDNNVLASPRPPCSSNPRHRIECILDWDDDDFLEELDYINNVSNDND